MALEWIDRPKDSKGHRADWKPFPSEAIVIFQRRSGAKSMPVQMKKVPLHYREFLGSGHDIFRMARLDKPKP